LLQKSEGIGNLLETFAYCTCCGKGLPIFHDPLLERTDDPMEWLSEGIGYTFETFAGGLPHQQGSGNLFLQYLFRTEKGR
jgi:hypothetical protein